MGEWALILLALDLCFWWRGPRQACSSTSKLMRARLVSALPWPFPPGTPTLEHSPIRLAMALNLWGDRCPDYVAEEMLSEMITVFDKMEAENFSKPVDLAEWVHIWVGALRIGMFLCHNTSLVEWAEASLQIELLDESNISHIQEWMGDRTVMEEKLRQMRSACNDKLMTIEPMSTPFPWQ